MGLTNKQKFNKMYKQPSNEPNSKADISRLTKIPIRFLDQVYDNGIGAWETNPQSVRKIKGVKLPKEAWAMARVYAFIVKRKEGNLDFDLTISSDIRKYKKQQKEKKIDK
tara:strand:- start:125 stop:454 length:330 start_codon:yes stop_codon:yes gene_type:complete